MRNINFIVAKMKNIINIGCDVSKVQFYVHIISEDYTGIQEFSLVTTPEKNDIPVFTLGEVLDILPENVKINVEDGNGIGKKIYTIYYKSKISKNNYYEKSTWGFTHLETALLLLEDMLMNKIL